MVYSPYILSTRFSDLRAFSIIEAMCSGYVILGKEPSAVLEHCTFYRKEEEIHAVGFSVFAVSLL